MKIVIKKLFVTVSVKSLTTSNSPAFVKLFPAVTLKSLATSRFPPFVKSVPAVAGNFNYQNHYLSNGTITANHLNFTARNGNFINNTTLTTGNLGITANNFNNAGGTITASNINLSVAGDFDYAADYLNNGTS